jgi:hypothetical protein
MHGAVGFVPAPRQKSQTSAQAFDPSLIFNVSASDYDRRGSVRDRDLPHGNSRAAAIKWSSA